MKKEKEEDGAGVKDGEAERIGRGEIRKEKTWRRNSRKKKGGENDCRKKGEKKRRRGRK